MSLFDPKVVSVFLLILFRMTAFLMTAPFFGSRAIPARAKLGLALGTTIILFPLLPWADFRPPANLFAFAIITFREILVGFAIGFAAQTLFAAVQMAGQLISFQMGMALARAFDPISGVQNTIVALMYQLFTLMIFLAINGHHFLLRGLVKSYEAIGLGEAVFTGSALQLILLLLSQLFEIAVLVAAPAMVVLFFASTLLAVIGRAIPQMQIFLVGLPMKLALGFIILIYSLDGIGTLLPSLFYDLRESIRLLIQALAPV